MDRYNVRPGLLVGLSTRIRGGVSYVRTDRGTQRDGATECREWETIQTTTDKEEHERAKQARNAGRAAVARVCIQTPFGLVCPVSRESDLQRAIDNAADVVQEFNQTASYSRVELYAIVGRIAENDAEAARAILADVREAVDGMKAGLGEFNPEKIREAADRARQIGRMLDDSQGERVTAAVKAARKAAREIAKRVSDGAETAAAFQLEADLEPLDALRFSFLDVEDAEAVEAPPIQAPEAEPEAPEPARQPGGAATGFETFPEPEPDAETLEAPAVDVARFADLEVE